jgi:hypothetical protein
MGPCSDMLILWLGGWRNFLLLCSTWLVQSGSDLISAADLIT